MGIEFRNPTESIGHARLSHLVTHDPKLSDGAKVTYAHLLKYAMQKEECYPGLARLALARGKTENTISRQLTELVDRGLISRERRVGTSSMTYIEPLEHVYGEVDIADFKVRTTYKECSDSVNGVTSHQKWCDDDIKNGVTVTSKMVCKEEEVEEEEVEEEEAKETKLSISIPKSKAPIPKAKTPEQARQLPDNLDEIWATVLADIQEQIPRFAFEVMIKPSSLLELTKTRAVVHVPEGAMNTRAPFQRAISEAVGYPVSVIFDYEEGSRPPPISPGRRLRTPTEPETRRF